MQAVDVSQSSHGAVHANWSELVDWQLKQVEDSPLYQQVSNLLRDQILSGVIPPGSRLPSTRQLMNRLGVSRTTVITAYAQLHADGYVTCKVGSGTYVADDVLEKLEHAQDTHAPLNPWPDRNGLSERGQRYADMALENLVLPNVPFNTGVVRTDGRTAAVWQQLVRHHVTIESMTQGYSPPQGSEALRQEIARYVGVARGVRCTPEQVIVVAGSQQATDLVIKVLLEPGAPVWVEDPGYPLTRLALATAGMALHSVPVDQHGLNVEEAIRRCPDARAVFVTPSHQYPLGIPLSIERRAQLLDWAATHRAWIVEDDYDSEFRYNGAALPALQGLDRNDRVAYTGTFSKVLSPSVRYGYLIVPPPLAKAFTVARFLTDRHSPVFFEHVMTDFMARGHFVSHIRRMRAEYGATRDALVRLLQEKLSHHLEVHTPNQGLHLVAYLRNGLVDTVVAAEAARAGVVVRPVSQLYADPKGRRSALMFGFAGFTESRMKTAVDRLAVVLDDLARRHGPGHRA